MYMKKEDIINNWRLNLLYNSFDQHYRVDVSRAKQMARELASWHDKSKSLPFQKKIEEFVQREESFRHLHEKVSRYARLAFFADNENEDARLALIKSDEAMGLWVSNRVDFLNWLKKVDSSELENSRHPHLERLKALAQHTGTAREEKLAQSFRSTGSRVMNSIYEKSLSTTSLAQCRSQISSINESDRREAIESANEIGEKLANTAAQCLNSIAGEWQTLAEMNNHSAALEQALYLCKTDSETLSRLIEAIEGMLPSFHSFFRLKAEVLGHKGPLPYFDLMAPLPSPSLQELTYEKACSTIIHYFGEANENLKSVAQRVIENEWIDWVPRKGKCPGAFCHPLRTLGQSRILINFTGSQGDLTTLAHEIGHAFHNDCLKERPIIEQDYSIAIAETASVFCELIVFEKLIEEADNNSRLGLLNTILSTAARLIVATYAHFLFEREVYEKRKERELTVTEFNEIMAKALRHAYGDSVETNCAKNSWVYRRHLFGTKRNFYNFPYAFGFVLASYLMRQYRDKKDDFFNRYEDFLALSGMADVATAASALELNIREQDCWQAVVADLNESVQLFEEEMRK
jgi:oligoendopeptidase F